MREITSDQYAFSKAVLAAYDAYCVPYRQKNGWTVIPIEAPRFFYEGKPADINAHSTVVELFELAQDKPEKFSAYVHEADSAQRQQTNFVAFQRRTITTWTGEPLGVVVRSGAWHRNNFGGKWRQLTIRTDWNQTYTGREYDSRQLVNFRRVVS